MCGIAGFFGKGTEADLKKMIAAVPYRGPDATEVYFSPDHQVGFAHARLAIIDLTPSGLQPMWNNAKTVVVAFNGEIYNFASLKKELSVSGYHFVGTSDTEVILALYEKEGERCFAQLDGMFAIALFDRTTNRLILARDRMGKKPVYWSMIDGTCVFGSEPKTLLAHPLVQPKVDLSALNMYLANDFVPTPFSIYKGISKLEPGSYLVVEGGRTRLQSFWTPKWSELSISESDAKEKLDQTIAHAVEERLVSDVPLGVFLSGGLDSSTVAWYAAQARKNIDTFAIGFEEASFDESNYAREVAKLLGTTHHERMLSATDALAIIPEIYAKLDEPMADASIIPTTLLSKFARESVTVALGGDGGDELFAGYPTFQAERAAGFYQMIPEFLRHGISRGVHALPPAYSNFSLEYKLKKFLDGADVSEMSGRHMRWLGTFGDDMRYQLLSSSVQEVLANEDPYVFASRRFAESASPDERNKLLFMYQRTYMMDEVMVKVDRASMYASLEARAPLLAREVVELANQLPYRYKLHGFTTKYLLKELMRGRLPDKIIDRPKKGFGVPTGAWLRGPLREWAEELLSEKSLNQENLFNMIMVTKLKNDHMEGRRDNRKELWDLVVFALWQKHWCNK